MFNQHLYFYVSPPFLFNHHLLLVMCSPLTPFFIPCIYPVNHSPLHATLTFFILLSLSFYFNFHSTFTFILFTSLHFHNFSQFISLINSSSVNTKTQRTDQQLTPSERWHHPCLDPTQRFHLWCWSHMLKHEGDFIFYIIVVYCNSVDLPGNVLLAPSGGIPHRE